MKDIVELVRQPSSQSGQGAQALRGATVVIAGASCGMGLATAFAFAREGSNLVLAARRESELQKAASDCEALGVKALPFVADVTDAAAMQSLARAATDRFGRIDVWINMAGLSLWGRFEDIPPEAQAQLIQVNLTGVINGSHAAVQSMLACGGRCVIINVASFAGRMPVPFSTAYTASKYGVAGFTGALRDELTVRSDIKVSAVNPTFVDTPTDLHSANYTGRTLRPLSPVLEPEDVARGIVGLALRRSAPCIWGSSMSWRRATCWPPRPPAGWQGAFCSASCSNSGRVRISPTASCSSRWLRAPAQEADGATSRPSGAEQ